MTGHPAPAIKWYKNGIEVGVEKLVSFDERTGRACLFIPSVNHDDDGNYTCGCSNPLGACATHSKLNVRGKS